MSHLAEVARESDRAAAKARSRLVDAVREASEAGMTQQQIAREIGRSQPEVSRLLRFHGTTPLARRLRAHRSEILRLIAAAGGSDVKVFGSLATETDHAASDVDLLFSMGETLDLVELARLERQLGDLIDASVDLVPDSSIRPGIRSKVLREAVPL